MRHDLPRHRLHGRLPDIHLESEVVPRPRPADTRPLFRRLQGRRDRRSGNKGGLLVCRLPVGHGGPCVRPEPGRDHLPGSGVAGDMRIPGLHIGRRAYVVGKPVRRTCRCRRAGILERHE